MATLASGVRGGSAGGEGQASERMRLRSPRLEVRTTRWTGPTACTTRALRFASGRARKSIASTTVNTVAFKPSASVGPRRSDVPAKEPPPNASARLLTYRPPPAQPDRQNKHNATRFQPMKLDCATETR